MVSSDQEGYEQFTRKSVRKVLKSWYNLQKLGLHPLADLEIVEKRRRLKGRDDTPAGRGLSLQDVLRDAIEALRVDDTPPIYSDRRWRSYIILKEEFLDGRNPDYLAVQLNNIARRTYHDAQGKAIDKLASILRQWEDEVHEILTPEVHRAIFLAPQKPAYRLVGRYNLLLELKGLLFAGGSVALCALNGLPGVGKTALAIELAHDNEVLTYFRDGILWVGLGRKPDLLSLLGKWAAALDIPQSEIAKLTTIADRANTVHAAIGMRHMLLVIDDAWQLEDALAFHVGGPHCAHLLTTRFPVIAQDFAEENALAVGELSPAGGLLLLGQLAPGVAEAEPDAAQRLVQAVGGLPLAIILMAKYARREASGEGQPLQTVLTRLQQVEERLMLAHPQSPVGSHPSLPVGAPLSLLAAISISDETLDEATRRALYSLSVFPPKPNDFSREAALTVTGQSAQILDILINAGLLESSGPDRYMLHQTINDYATIRLVDESVYERFIEFFVEYVKNHERDYDALDQEINNVLVALDRAFDQQLLGALIQGTIALYRYMETRGLYALAMTQLNRARQVAESQEVIEGLATVLASLGTLSEKQGNIEQARAHLQKSLELAYIVKDEKTIADVLRNLGVLAFYDGEYAETEAYWNESLAMARKIGRLDMIGGLLANLGMLAFNKGQFTEAEAYWMESLAEAREISDTRLAGMSLQHLGISAERQGNYDQAEKYYTEALALARQMKYHEMVATLLLNLGWLAIGRQDYKQAISPLEEGLTLARDIGNLWIITDSLNAWGVLHLEQGDLDTAMAAFREALENAEKMNNQELIGKALYGLAQVHAALGNVAEAYRIGKESITVFRSMSHYLEDEVTSWLAGLPSMDTDVI